MSEYEDRIEKALDQYRRDLSCPGMSQEDAMRKAIKAIRESCVGEIKTHLEVILKLSPDEKLRENLTNLINAIGLK